MTYLQLLIKHKKEELAALEKLESEAEVVIQLSDVTEKQPVDRSKTSYFFTSNITYWD